MKATNVTATAKSKFTLTSTEVQSVKSGERVSNDTIAIVETSSQFNKFRMNKLASEQMGVVAGNRIKILTTGQDSIDGKYLIAVASTEDISAAKLASPTKQLGYGVLQFNYAGVWSKITQGTVDAEEKGGAAFVQEGIAIERNGSYFIDHKTVYEIVEVENFDDENPLVDPLTGAEYTKVFALISPKFEAVDLTKETATRKDKAEADVEVEAELED